MTLEELLANEGFKRTRSTISTGASFGSPAASVPNSTYREQHKSGSFSDVRKTERTNSDLSRYRLRDELPANDGTNGRRPRYNLRLRDKLDRETREQGERDSSDLYDINNRSNRDSADDFPVNEIIEVGEEDGEGYQDLFSNKFCNPDRRNGKYSTGISERERPKRRSGKDIEVDNTADNSSIKHPLGHLSYRDYYGKSDKSLYNSGSSDDGKSQRLTEIERNVPEPALDEVQNIHEHVIDVQNVPEPALGKVQNVPELALDEIAVQAMVSIMCGYIRRFLNDEDFWTSLHHNCFTVLNFTESDEGIFAESKVIASLEQAIETVEGAAEERVSGKELIKASLQLRMITGLSSDDSKDGFTSGIPNSKISACAHLYLSVICTLQKKDRIAAKHLLQVFCNSPFEARTTLLPDLWDHMFLPHLSHLKAWYNQEADSLANTPSKARKLKLLEKGYNEIMDSGTYQFAVYYKDWLTEGVEGPSTPSIHIPSIPDHGAQRGGPQSYSVDRIRQEGTFSHSIGIQSPTEPFSPLPMVSKRLYDAVFGRSPKSGVNNVKEYKRVESFESFDPSTRSSDGSTVEGEQELTLSSAKFKHMYQNIERDNLSHHVSCFL